MEVSTITWMPLLGFTLFFYIITPETEDSSVSEVHISCNKIKIIVKLSNNLS
jgi:hypothetical protein